MNMRLGQSSEASFHQSNIFMRNFSKLNILNIPPPFGLPHLNLVRPLRETDATKQLSCDVVFGSPSSDCMGTGICRISARTGGNTSAMDQKRNCRSTMGLLFPIEGGDGVALVLTRALLCTQLYKTHLRHGTLTLESPCPLPKHIALTLGLKTSQLSIGVYPIREGEGFLRIDFKVNK